MKNYENNLEFAVIFKPLYDGQYTRLFLQGVVFGHLDNNEMFVDQNGNVYPPLINFGDELGYTGRTKFSSVGNLKNMPTFLVKHLILSKYKNKNFYYIDEEESGLNAPVITFGKIPLQKYKDFADALTTDKYKILCDNDIISFYNKYYQGFLHNTLHIIVRESKTDVSVKDNRTKYNINDIEHLYQDISSYVINQDEAIQSILTSIWKHYNAFGKKRNILIIGKTGVGKTAILRRLTSIVDIPSIIVNASSYTASGYVGLDVADMLSSLVSSASGNIQKAENGILVIDEIDKLGQEGKGGLAVKERAVQEELLKLVEDGIFQVNYKGNTYNFDTSKLMIIAMGSFSREEVQKINKIGYISQNNNPQNSDAIKAMQNRLSKNGLIDEFVGRFPIVIELNNLGIHDHLRIMHEGKDNILYLNKQFFTRQGVTLTLEKGTTEAIAEMSSKSPYGAREIDTIVEYMLKKASFEIACHHDTYSELIVSPETIKDNSKYHLVRKKEINKP